MKRKPQPTRAAAGNPEPEAAALNDALANFDVGKFLNTPTTAAMRKRGAGCAKALMGLLEKYGAQNLSLESLLRDYNFVHDKIRERDFNAEFIMLKEGIPFFCPVLPSFDLADFFSYQTFEGALLSAIWLDFLRFAKCFVESGMTWNEYILSTDKAVIHLLPEFADYTETPGGIGPDLWAHRCNVKTFLWSFVRNWQEKDKEAAPGIKGAEETSAKPARESPAWNHKQFEFILKRREQRPKITWPKIAEQWKETYPNTPAETLRKTMDRECPHDLRPRWDATKDASKSRS